MTADGPVPHRGVIVAVDGSPASTMATEWAAREAALRHVRLTLVHVLADPVLTMWPEPPLLDDFWTWRDTEGRQILDDARPVADAAIRGSDPIVVEQATYAGSTISTLADLSKDAELIVVGRRGHGGMERRLIGSVSAGVVRHAHCPVAVIHGEEPLVVNPGAAPVLVGIDGSPASELATAIAFDEASRRGVDVVAMHSWADYGPKRFISVDWQRQLEVGTEALAERLAGWQERYPEVAVDRRLVHGEPAAQLVAASETAQLMVIGSHGRGGFAGMLLGSVSSAVVEAVKTPLIIARQP